MLNKYDKFHRNSEMASLSNYGYKTIKNVQKDPQTTEIWSTKRNVAL